MKSSLHQIYCVALGLALAGSVLAWLVWRRAFPYAATGFVALAMYGLRCGPGLLADLMSPSATPRPDPTICATCGYDLRATPERCPECGTVVKRPEQAK